MEEENWLRFQGAFGSEVPKDGDVSGGWSRVQGFCGFNNISAELQLSATGTGSGKSAK